jgi:hypothetical protein
MRTFAGLLTAVTLLAGPAGLRADDVPSVSQEWQETVEGVGKTREAAHAAALKEAEAAVSRYLVANYPEIRWNPSGEYLKRTGIATLYRGPNRVDDLDGSLYHVVYRLNRLNEHHLADLRELSRVPWMYQRHRQAALVLGGLVLSLLVFVGYLRLHEMTHGYYATRLFVVAAGLVALIGYAVWSWL